MKCHSVLLLLVVLAGCWGRKMRGRCSFNATNPPSQNQFSKVTRWNLVGYLPSEAPYENPFYLHYDQVHCNEFYIEQEGLVIDFFFQCKSAMGTKRICQSCIFDLFYINQLRYPVSKSNALDQCQRWTNVLYFSMNFASHLIILGCEDIVDEDAHYVGLWILREKRHICVQAATQDSSYQEKLVQLIPADVFNDVIFVNNSGLSGVNSNCSCQSQHYQDENCYIKETRDCWRRSDSHILEASVPNTSIFAIVVVLICFLILVSVVKYKTMRSNRIAAGPNN